jgi:hypothetical protein
MSSQFNTAQLWKQVKKLPPELFPVIGCCIGGVCLSGAILYNNFYIKSEVSWFKKWAYLEQSPKEYQQELQKKQGHN